MKAIFAYGPKDIRLDDIETESLKPGQIRVRTARGGICGSDLHYYNQGGFGDVRLKEPMILGHEVSGYISELGEGVDGFSIGDLIAISPSRPCGQCSFCQKGQQNHCLNMRFYGSAMPFPHIQGAFRNSLIIEASQAVLAEGISAEEAAMAEPLSVALHAVNRAGNLLGKTVMVTGCGPIGAMCILAARRAGAAKIVAIDISDFPLRYARSCGADLVVNSLTEPQALDVLKLDKGQVDVLIECSGSEAALANAIQYMAPGGIIVQLGMGGAMTLPVMQITAKELELRGSFRFHKEFPEAVSYMASGLIDVKPLLTHTFGVSQYREAFEQAVDRSTSMKVQLCFDQAQ